MQSFLKHVAQDRSEEAKQKCLCRYESKIILRTETWPYEPANKATVIEETINIRDERHE